MLLGYIGKEDTEGSRGVVIDAEGMVHFCETLGFEITDVCLFFIIVRLGVFF